MLERENGLDYQQIREDARRIQFEMDRARGRGNLPLPTVTGRKRGISYKIMPTPEEQRAAERRDNPFLE